MQDLALLLFGVGLSVLSQPNEWFPEGWGILGLVSLVPVFWFTARRSPGFSALGGVFWAVLFTLISQFWLVSFHPLAFPLVLLFQAPWYAGAFFVSSLLWRKLPWGALWFQALLWTVMEFLRIQGFFSFPYGSIASSFWALPLAWQSADLVGTSGITFLLAWSSAWIAALLSKVLVWQKARRDLAIGLGFWTLNLGYGAIKLAEAESGPLWKPALIQQSQDPWKGGAAAYEAAYERLESLSKQALAATPDVVIWSETAFVPSVEFHTRYHENPASLRLVRRLEEFLNSSSTPFLIGNDHREKSDNGELLDYNAVLSWNGGWTGRYEKNRLVPFTESFPYRDQFPWVYQWLKDADTHFWEAGRGRPLLMAGEVPVGTPICYEDTFADGARAFSLAGARALVNVTNDSWALGTASRMQHLSLAVFRAVETRMPLVRAGNDGATVAVSARGVVLNRLPVGPPGVLTAEVSLGSGQPTLYTLTGDWLPWVALALLIAGLSLSLTRPNNYRTITTGSSKCH